MKIFVSWSGEASRKLGEALRKWLPAALHVVKPYFSPDDIEKGTRWETEISRELETSDFGIICLTQDNVAKPWIMFEAGALAKKFEASRVCPILFGIGTPDIQGPLSQFQCTKFTKQDMRKLLKTINSLCGEHKLESDVLEEVFNMWWPKLEQSVTEILSEAGVKEPSKPPSESAMLQEILELLRMNVDLTRRAGRARIGRFPIDAIAQLAKTLQRAHGMSVENQHAEVAALIADAATNLEKLIEVTGTAKQLPLSLKRLRAIRESEEASDASERDES